jgi:hypothetical protein
MTRDTTLVHLIVVGPDQTTCPKIIGDVHLWVKKHQTTTSKATTQQPQQPQQPQRRMFVFQVHQPPYLCGFAI